MSGHIQGITLHFVCKASGIGQSKIKMILSRHPELRETPYSARTGGARIFFQPFIEWLAKYEGAEAAEKMGSHKSHASVTSVTPRLSGALIREMRPLYRPEDLALRLDHLMGFPSARALPALEAPATPEQARIGFAAATAGLPARSVERVMRTVAAVTERSIKAELDKAEADRKQGRLL